MNGCRLPADASGIICIRIRPIPGPSACAAITTKALLDFCRPPTKPSAKPPRKVSSTYFNPATQPIPVWPDHRPPQLVQPGPGRLVAPQSQNALQAERTGTILLAGDVPHGAKPRHQRFARVLKNRPGRGRGLTTGNCDTDTPPHAPLPPPRLDKPGQRNPPGQRSASRYARHASGVENRLSNSSMVRG